MKRARDVSNGFSLVEVTLALGVAAISLVAIFGLLATGLQTNYSATEQTASSDILAAVAADLRATPKTTPLASPTPSLQFGINIPANPVSSPGPSPTTLYFNAQGQSSTSPNASSRYRLVITFRPNGAGSRTATFVDLRMTWPAAAAPTSANTGAAEIFAALERN
jgi:uncharacterized protein (TIGR02598 family)